MNIKGYEICRVEREEQVNYFVSELAAKKGHKIAFVVHPRSQIFLSNVNMDLIKLASERNHNDLIFITSHEQSRYLLEQAGFKVYNNLDSLDKGVALKTMELPLKINRGAAKSRQYLVKAFSLIFALIFLVTLAFFILQKYPAATIEVRPVIQSVKKEILVEADLLAENPQWEKGIIPLHSFLLIENMEKDFPVRGTKYKGTVKATGTILLFNDSDKEIILPKDTIVLTDKGIRFKTLDRVVVPPRTGEVFMDLPVGIKAGQVEVGIEAIEAGSLGNVAAGEISTLAGREKSELYIVNPYPTNGGTDELIRIVSEEDFNWAKKSMEEYLRSEVLRAAYRKLSGEYRIIEESVGVEDCQITFAHKLGDEEILLKGLGIIKSRGYMVSHKILDQVLTYKFLQGIKDKESIPKLQVSLQKVIPKETKIVLHFEVEAVAAAPVDVKGITTALAGIDINEARGFLANQKDIQSFCILSPDSGNISKLPLAVRVVIQSPF